VSAKVGQTIIIENRPGGGGAIGVSAVAKAEPDGHTILVHSNALVTAPAIQSMPYDPVRDFAGVTPLGNVPLVLVISPDKNIKTLKELVALAKAKPGSINYAAAGIGTPPHLTTERFRLAANFEGQLVPFKGAPEALTEVITGRVDFYFCPITPAMPFIKEGKLLALAVSSTNRASALPDVPTTVEAGFPDSDFDFWIGMVVPKKTPRAIVARIHEETVDGLKDPAVREKLAKLGVEPMIMTPEAFDARIARRPRLP
jgi:tripartite-type tricarboxylate transporter receptor subunit TctC